MWILLAILSAIFAGVTSILAKVGIKNTDSNLATALRTFVVLIMSIIMVLIVGSFKQLTSIDLKSWIFLILSGISTGASWLCYFKALQLGDVNKVVPIDKSSVVITIVFAIILFHEDFNLLKCISIILITVGTYLMIEKKQSTNTTLKKSWIIFACLSAIFASLTSLLAKAGINNVESNLGTLIRTFIVLMMAWLIVFMKGKTKELKKIKGKELLFIILSGIATGASWLCYYKAMKDGVLSGIIPIDKLSILVTISFSYVFLKEKLSLKAICGLILICIGTILMIF